MAWKKCARLAGRIAGGRILHAAGSRGFSDAVGPAPHVEPPTRPRPRRHLVTYHGVLAPAASLRSRVVPRVPAEQENGAGQADAASNERQQPEELQKVDSANRRRDRVPHRPAKRRVRQRYYTWAELLRRVYAVDVLTCPNCHGPRRLLAAIQNPLSIEKVLRAMKLPFHAPELAPARAPPAEEGTWWGA